MTTTRRLVAWAGALLQGLGLSFLLVVSSAALSWFFAIYVPGKRAEAIEGWGRDLSLRADLRRDLLERRIGDIQTDLKFFAVFPTVRALLTPGLPAETGAARAEHLRGILSDFRRNYRFLSASIVDASGRVLVTSDGPAPNDAARAIAAERIASGRSGVALVRGPDGTAKLVAAVPVTGDGSGASGSPALGALLVVGDASIFLFDLLGYPMAASSSESYLVGKDDQAILFLSPLRFRPDPPLSFRLPLATADLAAHGALVEKSAFHAFSDYRGARVLAAVRRIDGVAWGLVVKVDEEEALAPFRREILQRGTAWGALLLALCAAVIAFARLLRIAERRESDVRIGDLNRLLRTISQVDSLLIKVADEKFLLEEVCRILVESGGYVLVWIGRADAVTMRAIPVARAGAEAQLLDSIEVRWDDSPQGRGPFGTAIRTGRHVVVQDIGADTSVSPWTAFSSRLGIRSMAVLPLRRGGAVTAALIAYSVVPAFLDGEEVGLLDGLAGNISFALDALDDRERVRLGEAGLRDLSRALEQSEAYFRSLIESSHDLTAVLHPDGRVRYSSPSIERILGYKPGELAEHSVFEFIHEEDRQRAGERLREAVTEGIHKTIEVRFRHKDASWRTLSAIGNSLPAETGMTGLIINARDVTERLKLESQFHQAQKMEAVGRLAGGVAHDFNNLLTVIHGYGELLLASLDDDAEKRENLGEILKASERASALTQQLLAFSRHQVLEMRVLDIGAVVDGIEKMLRRLIGEDIELAFRKPAALGRVKADPGQIEQVVLNLAVNSRDAMPGGGRLTLALENVDLGEPLALANDSIPPGPYVVLSVTDTGTGMDAETVGHVFEPFFTTKERGKGTGLGLATVYGIVRQSGGYVAVETNPGAGTTFRIYLPRCAEPMTAENPHSGETSDGTETVLLVEDERAVRALAKTVLERRGYSVIDVEDGPAALDVVSRDPRVIHVLLTDVILPKMNGVELASRVRELRPLIKLVFMSGYTADVLKGFDFKAGQALLAKPFSGKALAAKIREVLDVPEAAPPSA